MKHKWTEQHIQQALAHRFFVFTRNICIPNVSWGFAQSRGEKDLVVLSKAGYVTEVEIKIGAADLRRECLKSKHERQSKLIRRYFIAAPRDVWQRVNGCQLPDGAGKLELWLDTAGQPVIELTQPAKLNPNAHPLTPQQTVELMRLACFRIWTWREFSQCFPYQEAKVA